MNLKFSSNAFSKLAVSISPTDTSVLVVDAVRFPVLEVGDYYYLDLVNIDGNNETVKVVGAVGNQLTVQRGCGGTIAKFFAKDNPCGLRVGKAFLDDVLSYLEERDVVCWNHAADSLNPHSTTALQVLPSVLGNAKKALVVNAAGTAVEWGTVALGSGGSGGGLNVVDYYDFSSDVVISSPVIAPTVVARFCVVRSLTIPPDFYLSRAKLASPQATPVLFTLRDATVVLGTVEFAANSTVGVWQPATSGPHVVDPDHELTLTLSSLENPPLRLSFALAGYSSNNQLSLDFKANVYVTTTGPISLWGDTQTVDDVAVASGHRVLVKDQVDPVTNGIYVVTTTAWQRASDASEPIFSGMYVEVDAGSCANTAWLLITNNPIAIGTTKLYFVQIPKFHSNIYVSSGDFSGLLQPSDNTVQKALKRLDLHTHTVSIDPKLFGWPLHGWYRAPKISDIVFEFVFGTSMVLPANWAGSRALVVTPALTTTYSVYHNNTVVGTITFVRDISVGIFSSLATPRTFAVGETLRVVCDKTDLAASRISLVIFVIPPITGDWATDNGVVQTPVNPISFSSFW